MTINEKMLLFLREYAAKNKLNQDQLSEKIGVKRPQLTRWMNGHVEISSKSIHSICENLGISVEILIDGK